MYKTGIKDWYHWLNLSVWNTSSSAIYTLRCQLLRLHRSYGSINDKVLYIAKWMRYNLYILYNKDQCPWKRFSEVPQTINFGHRWHRLRTITLSTTTILSCEHTEIKCFTLLIIDFHNDLCSLCINASATRNWYRLMPIYVRIFTRRRTFLNTMIRYISCILNLSLQ